MGETPNSGCNPSHSIKLARVAENRRLTAPGNPSDVRHVVLEFARDALAFQEGQAVGVPPPGLNQRGRPHPPRLFSVASARDGEYGDGQSLALTVKRFFGQDPATGAAIPGLASNFLCDCAVGDQVRLTGPLGDLLRIPDDEPGPLLLFATGTGVAPMRGLLQRRARSAAARQFAAALLHGAPTADDLAYSQEFEQQARGDSGLAYLTARSREQTDNAGQRLYVGQLALNHRDQLAPLLAHPALQVLVCGVRGMEEGVERAIAAIGGEDRLARLRAEGRWRVEVY